MNHTRLAFCMMCVFGGLVVGASRATAADEVLGKYGQTEINYQSLDELMPFVVLSVTEPQAFGVTWDKMAALKVAYQLMESQEKNNRSFGKTLAEYQPLVERFLQLDATRPMGLILFADEEMIYPMVVFPISGNFEPVDLQAVEIHNRVWQMFGDENSGLLKEDFLWWGTRGHYAFVTVKPLVHAVPNNLGSLCERYFAASNAEATLEIHFIDAPKYLVSGLIQVADFILRYGEGMKVTEQYFNRYASNSLFDLGSNESVRQTMLAWLQEIRDAFRQIRRYKATVAFADSGDLVFTSAMDFVPETEMGRQMNARKNQPQSLQGFYRPDNAVFASGEGGFLRPRQQKMIAGLWEGIRESMNGMAKWQVQNAEQTLTELKSREELIREKPEMAEVIANIDFSTVNADHPAKEKINSPFEGYAYPEILPLEENRPYFEKQLADNKANLENMKLLQDFFAATFSQSYQEGAATLGDDHIFIAAARIAEGAKLREFLRGLISMMTDATGNNRLRVETDMPEYKGFHFITVSWPVIPEDILELKPSGFIRRNVRVSIPGDAPAPAQESVQMQFPSGFLTAFSEPVALEPTSVDVISHPEAVHTDEALVPFPKVLVDQNGSQSAYATPGQPLVPANESTAIATKTDYPFGLSKEEFNKIRENMRIGEEKAVELALERRRKALENLPDALKNSRGQVCLGISEDVFCIAVGLDVDHPEKALHDAIDRCGNPQPFGSTLMVFRPHKMGETLQHFAPLMLEASDADYHDFVKELLALSPETTVRLSTRFTETERIDTVTVGREYFNYYQRKMLQIPSLLPLPPYLNNRGTYEIEVNPEKP